MKRLFLAGLSAGFLVLAPAGPTTARLVPTYDPPSAPTPVSAFQLPKTARHRHHHVRRPWSAPVVASWFDDSGQTGCGFHAALGFATLLPIPCGAHVQMIGPSGLTVEATREDSGPYVAGRTFDLNPELRDALGCGGLCDVRFR